MSTCTQVVFSKIIKHFQGNINLIESLPHNVTTHPGGGILGISWHTEAVAVSTGILSVVQDLIQGIQWHLGIDRVLWDVSGDRGRWGVVLHNVRVTDEKEMVLQVEQI